MHECGGLLKRAGTQDGLGADASGLRHYSGRPLGDANPNSAPAGFESAFHGLMDQIAFCRKECGFPEPAGAPTMANRGAWMIYGANGYTGHLVAVEAKRRGLNPVLAGRPCRSNREIGHRTRSARADL